MKTTKKKKEKKKKQKKKKKKKKAKQTKQNIIEYRTKLRWDKHFAFGMIIFIKQS